MATKAMTTARRRAFDGALKKLCADLQVDEIIAHLISAGKLTDTDCERVKSKETSAERVRELVKTLKTKGDDAFDAFVEGLQETPQAFLAKDLLGFEEAQRRQEDQEDGDGDFFRVDVESDDDSEDTNDTGEPTSLSFDSFLKSVGLEDMFPCLLTLDNLCKIKYPDRHAQNFPSTSLHELFWEKLGSLDYRACSKDIFTNHSGTPPREISVRDFVFAILHCSDTFLRQDILEKMSACQLAVPILLHGVYGQKSTFLIWSLRRIVKKWKKLNSLAVEYPIVTIPVFSVAFMRIGEIRQVSKSLILNHIIGPHQGFRKHSYFLSKDDDSRRSSFSEGCVEGVWYLPSNSNNSEKFKNVMSILNLRGDCGEHPSATSFCCKAANLCIVLVAKQNLNQATFRAKLKEMKKQNSNMKFIQIDDERVEPPAKARKCKWDDDWLFVRFFDMNDVCSQISFLISTECNNFPDDKLFSLEQMNNRCEKIKVEEENKSFCKARQYVADICKSETMKDLRSFKTKAFPLQNMWLEWVKIDKENVEPDAESDKSVEFILEEMKTRKLKQREKQLRRGLSPQMKIFKEVLDMVEEDVEIWGYFSSYLQEKLRQIEDENISGHRMRVSQLQVQIDNLDQRIKPKLNESSEDGSIRPKQRRLAEEEKLRKDREKLKRSRQGEMRQCRDKSLSFEYFLRELAQWYEAYTDLGETDVDATIELLPALAARLLVNGHSIEIMDGDSGRVPLTWVRRLLTDLMSLIQDAPILVLSVIGVQSSGKSTLLNTMFGVRFNVRAGLCTRGLFLRVIRVDEQYADILKVKYVFLIDSEGIRSQERTAEDQYRFDNELVTLALCVSDVTILNISGDNIGPDMTGLLQIAAHALIRMKRVDLHSHCRIVQQRVGDITADEANKLTMTQIEESLNQVISQVAAKEGFGNRYQVFSDVFELMRDQSGENLQYFPSLWTGRPMSPPNELYSERVTRVRERILADVASRRIEAQFTVSTFSMRIQDVWMAVKHEKFLFNFTDSVKAIDFENLCMEFNKWVTEVKGKLMEEMSKWKRSISVSKGDDNDMLESIRRELRNELSIYEKALRDAFDKHVATHPRKGTIIAKYNTWFDQTVKLAIADEQASALSLLENHIKTKNMLGVREASSAMFRLVLRENVKTEAEKLRNNKMNDEEINTHFFTMWKIWVERKEEDVSADLLTDEKFAETIEGSLLNITTDMSINQEITTLIEDEGGLKNHSIVTNWADYYPTKGGAFSISEWFRSNEEKLKKLIDESLVAIRQKKSVNKFDFDPVIREALNKLSAQTFSSEPPSNLKAKILLHICAKIFEVVLQSQTPHESVMSLTNLPQEDKELLLGDFRAILKSDSCTERALVFAYRLLSNAGRQAVVTGIGNQLVQAMLPICNDMRFLTRIVLSTLCQTNTHEEYISYIGKHSECINRALTHKVLELCQHQTDGELTMRCHANLALRKLVENLREAVRDATIRTKNRTADSPAKSDQYVQWIKHFVASLSRRSMTIHPVVAEELQWYDVQDMEHFTGELTVHIDTKLEGVIVDEMHIPSIRKRYNVKNFLEKSNILQSILSLISNSKGICFEQCPFCGAPCANVLPQHEEHHAITHIPRGISGEKRKKRLTVDDCQTCVVSSTATYTLEGEKKPFMKYWEDFPSWVIKPKVEPAPSQSIYWKWVMAQHNELFAKHYGCEPAKIPPSWRRITQDDAMNSVNPPGLAVTIDIKNIIEGGRVRTVVESSLKSPPESAVLAPRNTAGARR